MDRTNVSRRRSRKGDASQAPGPASTATTRPRASTSTRVDRDDEAPRLNLDPLFRHIGMATGNVAA